jgi:hypothetical protein
VIHLTSCSNRKHDTHHTNEKTTRQVGTQTTGNVYFSKSATHLRMKKRLKKLKQTVKRRNVKINNMHDLVKQLQSYNNSSNNITEVLRNNFEGFPLELFQNEATNSQITSNRQRYSQQMKEFPLTLYFYSPKAFNFVRSKLSLPHSSTI